MTIITAAEIQKGDLIRVTNTEQQEDRKYSHTYEGVAAVQDADYKGQIVWRTEKRNNLWVHEDGAVIELLEPKIELPTSEYAVIEYQRLGTVALRPLRRVATLRNGEWKVIGEIPERGAGLHKTFPGKVTPAFLTELLNDGYSTSDFEVLFEGVAK